LKPFGERTPIENVNVTVNNYVIIDGIKTKEGVGAAFSLFKDHVRISKKYKLAKYCSQFQAYYLAIKKSIEFLINKFSNTEEITIVALNSVVESLRDVCTTKPQINEIQNLVGDAREMGIKVMFCERINSIENNIYEDVRNECQNAIRSHNRIEYDVIPKNFVKNLIEEKNIELWEIRWQRTTTGTGTKQFFPNIKKRIECEKQIEFDFKFTQILSNHGRMNGYLKRFNLTDDDNCEKCLVTDDNIHRIYDCIKYEKQRDEFKRQIELKEMSWPLSTTEMIDHQIICDFKNFCKSIV